jgi:hypothetical protein
MAFPKCSCRCSAHMHHGIMKGVWGICAMDFRGEIAAMVVCIYTLGFVGCGCWNTEKISEGESLASGLMSYFL